MTLKEIQAYHDAVYGEGPHALLWKDKPHRLVIELVEHTKKLQKQLESLQDRVCKDEVVITLVEDKK